MCDECGSNNHDFHLESGQSEKPHHHHKNVISIERDLLEKNNAFAEQNRKFFSERKILSLNMMSSPGSGKTTFLVKSIEMLKDYASIAVIEGDQETNFDAERIRESGANSLQINTGKGCHLDAHMVSHALKDLSPDDKSLLFIENVGNLVCPAEFDLGESYRVVMTSVTEGEDKPLKYPLMFRLSHLVILNKMDLLPHVSFSVEKFVSYLRKIRPNQEIIMVSALTGEGMTPWIQWLHEKLYNKA